MINQLDKLLAIGNSKIPFSEAERKASMKKLYALVDCFSLPNWFLTISPDDINHFLTIRLCVNDCFHCGNDFNGIVIEKHIVEDNSFFNLYKLHTENPVAVASSFNDMIESLIDILLKGSNSEKLRKIKIFKSGGKGLLGLKTIEYLIIFIILIILLLGRLIAYFFVFEVQGRGSLHTHIALWCGGVTPFLLESVSALPGTFL